MDSGEVAPGDRQVAGGLGAARKRNRVVALRQLLGAHRLADMRVVVEGDAFGLHLLDAPVDVTLLELEVGNAVAKQAAGLGLFFVDMNVVARSRELLGAGETGGAGADNGDRLAGLRRGRLGMDPALGERAVDDRALDRLDRDGRVLDVQRAGRLAGRGTDAAGELREIVGREKVARRLLPLAAIGEIVPVRDLVVDRASVVAIGDAAIHAARRLIARRFLAQRNHEFAIMANPVGGGRVAPIRAIDFQKACHLAHTLPSPLTHRGRARGGRPLSALGRSVASTRQ